MTTSRLACVVFGCWCAMQLDGRLLVGEPPTQSVRAAPQAMIKVGQSIDDATNVLRDRDIEWHETILETTGTEGVQRIAFSLGQDEVRFIISYAESKRRIDGLLMQVVPTGLVGKRYHVYLQARSIQVNTDGSYVVHFLPPAKPRASQDGPKKSVYPRGPVPRSTNPR